VSHLQRAVWMCVDVFFWKEVISCTRRRGQEGGGVRQGGGGSQVLDSQAQVPQVPVSGCLKGGVVVVVGGRVVRWRVGGEWVGG
jgi:hypothetical protein